MEKFDLYQDIACRTGGDIYIGVVGPVRTGKSTFISRFMDKMVIPAIKNEDARQRAIDELPQSADGKTIMTTQPKFVPGKAVQISLGEKTVASVRMIDCVGYLVDGAIGHLEGEEERMVRTPWSDKEMSFARAAEIGTQKVIEEHSTIGILVTSDGTVTEIQRASYVSAEERVVSELKEKGKPFVIVLNSRDPDSERAEELRQSLEQKYGVPVICLNVYAMTEQDIHAVMAEVLYQFPLRRVDIALPDWMQALPSRHEIIKELICSVKESKESLCKMRDAEAFPMCFKENKYFEIPVLTETVAAEGTVCYRFDAKEGLFGSILADIAGEDISSEVALMQYIQRLAKAKSEYDKLKDALNEVKENGYGVVTPSLDEMVLEEPEIVRHGTRFGVKLKASAPSLHIMRVDIKTEVNPIVGTEQQSEEMVKYLLSEFENDPKGLWETNMFGKSLHALVNENLSGKLHAMPQDAQRKMRKTLGRMVNEGRGGMICILL
ncbi:MAG: stage IV sporulation protein A [Clostridia bacterium]|nr:stage IV sporulation protein A [Clostridia bacterium]